MKEYFKEQFENENLKPISKEILKKLKGSSYYSEYQEDDIVVAFMKQEFRKAEPPYTEPSINMQLQMIAERDIDKLKNDFKYIGMSTKYPVLERIINE